MDIMELIDAVDTEEFSRGLPAALRGADRERVRDLITTAHELEQHVGEPLTAAWLELDSCRSVLVAADHPAVLGRLDLVASLLREAVFNLLSTSAKCRTAALDDQAVECG
jgi:hypothetical protein